MTTTLVTATLRVALPVRLTGHDRKGGGEEGWLLKAGAGDGDKGGAVTRAHGRAAGARGTPAACRLQQARAGGKKERTSTSGAGGGGAGAAGVFGSGTPAAST